VRRLIINADDFGLTPGVNRAIAEGFTRGVITSATLMANGDAFDDAVATAKRIPSLAVGCHIVLVDGAPVLPPHLVPTLLGQGTGFRTSVFDFSYNACRNRLDADEVESEAIAQIRRLQSAGIRVSHVDTHKHTHLFPAVLAPVLRAAKACGVLAVRNPVAPMRPLPLETLAMHPKLWTRFAEVQLLRPICRNFRRTVEREGMFTTDATFGIVVTGTLNLNLFRIIMASMPEGTWEFVCHPGYNDGDLARVNTRLRASRVTELEVITSPEARDILNRNGIELISYRDLVVPSSHPSGAAGIKNTCESRTE